MQVRSAQVFVLCPNLTFPSRNPSHYPTPFYIRLKKGNARRRTQCRAKFLPLKSPTRTRVLACSLWRIVVQIQSDAIPLNETCDLVGCLRGGLLLLSLRLLLVLLCLLLRVLSLEAALLSSDHVCKQWVSNVSQSITVPQPGRKGEREKAYPSTSPAPHTPPYAPSSQSYAHA